MGMSQNSDARNFPLSVKYINISFEHPYFETFPDLCGCLSFRSCNLSLSMRLFRRRVGINGRVGHAVEKNRDREINNLVVFLIISSFVNRNYFHSSVHEGVHAAIPEMLQDKDFCWQTPTYYVF